MFSDNTMGSDGFNSSFYYAEELEDYENGSNHMRYPPYPPTNSHNTHNWEHSVKTTKKKPKYTSPNIPNKKEWTVEEAEIALNTEKAYNKKLRNALIITFPDHELSKEIVSQLHSSIESVHFQQPRTPQFCYITIQKSADPEEVISALNKQKFGDGFLRVEYKKDRDDDQVKIDDIDPLTLYVGNLSREVTKEDIFNLYPNNKRIDIGLANKILFTRYAFIKFRTASESLKAFKLTHWKEMYGKNLNVRFRRLRGPNALPGEAQPQNLPKTKDDSLEGSTVSTANNEDNSTENGCVEIVHDSNVADNNLSSTPPLAVNLEDVNQEIISLSSSDDEKEYKLLVRASMSSLQEISWTHQSKVTTEPNINVKQEERGGSQTDRFNLTDGVNVKHEQRSDSYNELDNLHCDGPKEKDEDEEDDDSYRHMMDFDSP